MKIKYLLLILILVACSRKECNSSIDSSKQINDIVSQIGHDKFNHLALYKDSASMERYQTFDEYTMSGKGRVTSMPFVYVKRHRDSIFVLSTNKNDSARLYVKIGNNIWYSHMEYDMWKKKNYIPSKDKLSKTARVYDRFFYNDTIMEVEGATAPFEICSAASKPETNFPEIGPTTNHVYCPSLKETLGEESKVPEGVNYIPEIVVNAINEESMNKAIKAGIDAALGFDGVVKISAGNFEGKLGDKNINLLDILK